MRVVLADPPAYTPPYDHALAAALARQGVDVRLLTSRFRYGAVPAASGYTVDDSLYRLSTGIGSGHGRLAVKAIEHPLALARLALARCDLVHLQWVSAPEADAWLLHTREPLVFTAHDLLPRRTARHTRSWTRLFQRFDRVVIHSEHGRSALAAFGVPATKLRVIPHPAFSSNPAREDDGRTVLALGVIRPYKGLSDAVEAVLGVPGVRLLVAGDPRVPLDALRAAAGDRAEWRLGYLSEAEITRALGSATVAVFPYRAELDQSGALLRAIGAGVPSVVYDVGGLGEIVGAFGAGRVVPPGDVEGLKQALRELLNDAEALAEARAGAERARTTLTWDKAAAAHVALYEELG
jgi:glycosyltransferase involved in cell wall biosynthesis